MVGFKFQASWLSKSMMDLFPLLSDFFVFIFVQLVVQKKPSCLDEANFFVSLLGQKSCQLVTCELS